VKDDTPAENQNKSIEKAVRGLTLLKESILELLRDHPEGLRNTDIARTLTLESDHQGNQRDYLTYSILGLLLKEGKIDKTRRGLRTFYTRNT
jgi:hypothetical protein